MPQQLDIPPGLPSRAEAERMFGQALRAAEQAAYAAAAQAARVGQAYQAPPLIRADFSSIPVVRCRAPAAKGLWLTG